MPLEAGNKFLEALARTARIMAPAARDTCRVHEDDCSWLLNRLALWAERAYGPDVFDHAARGYAGYCLHVAQAQNQYERTGIYNAANLSAIRTDVYGNDAYMTPYMWAAILIYAFWPSMVRHIGMFRRDFLDIVPPDARLLELACGHGVMGLTAAEHRTDIALEGYDLSPGAVAIAQRLLSASGIGPRACFAVKDVLTIDLAEEPGRYQGIIAAMLAEHLEDPEPLFAVIKHHLAPHGIAFFSTAIESAQCDHIHAFHAESDVLRLAEAAGLRARLMISDGRPREPQKRFRPRAVAAILEHL